MKRWTIRICALLLPGAIVEPARASVGLWDATAPDVWGLCFLVSLVLAVVMLVVFLRTRRIMFRTAAIGLALQAFGISIHLLIGWQVIPMMVAIAGTCVILLSGVYRPSM